MSKGSARRPTDRKKFDENFDRIFNNKAPVDANQGTQDQSTKTPNKPQ